jgi:hypothetical protein
MLIPVAPLPCRVMPCHARGFEILHKVLPRGEINPALLGQFRGNDSSLEENPIPNDTTGEKPGC